jgi:hypothetical protein
MAAQCKNQSSDGRSDNYNKSIFTVDWNNGSKPGSSSTSIWHEVVHISGGAATKAGAIKFREHGFSMIITHCRNI